ncbi:hypothetical protein [Anabaena sp. 4-3]|uniref:hypothetical protein n=1 Tax=Anabaena sp. 4-3 TaxID=1811979 RepID=UPI0008352ECA|nr:hypothetical protein [Anabaena sp. 4-3]
MLNANGNLWHTIIKSLFVAMNIGLISLGVVSCGTNQQPLTPIEQPTVNTESSPAQTDQDDDDDDQQDDDGDDQEQDTEEQNRN